MKKNKSVLLSLIIFSFIFPLFVFAAPTITLEFFSENTNSQTGKLDLWLIVNTISIPNGTNVAVDLYKNGVKDGPTINVPITSNYGEYRSGSVLDPATNYTVQATALGATANFERVTSGNPIIGIDPPVVVTGIATPDTSNTYTLLAPIGGMTTAPTNIGDYFNKIFLIVIGLCGALAVVMIVIGGVQYMGDESIFGKTEAKGQIKNAILGLLIALASYVLLNTINPDLLGKGGVNIAQVSAVISPEDTSTGSSTSLCLSTTNPPDPNTATGNNLPLNATIKGQYLPALNQISGLSTGVKLLITAQTAMEGFSSGTKSYTTNNPGNIGNTDNGSTKTYSSLTEGIQAQVNIIKNIASGTSPSYKAGSKPTCALGSEAYNGYLYQYLRIYATGARVSNAYLNVIIGYFKANSKTITAKTTISEIYNMK